ncbi:MAG: hypothetical protein ACP5N3_01605 [Candidatus Nanoarchaeia archaeon]
MVNISWTSKYPSKETLRKEIDLYTQTFTEVFLKKIGKENVKAIYFKGSGNKKWDSLLDYVPGLSDIDIHILFRNQKKYKNIADNITNSLKFSQILEDAYLSRARTRIHIPLLQIRNLNELKKRPFYQSTPEATVKTLYGEKYRYEKINETKNNVLKSLQEHDDFINKFPDRLIDTHIDQYSRRLKEISWRLSPSASNLLVLIGEDYTATWSKNRTETYNTLKNIGEKKLAEDFASFYVYSWNYYLTKDRRDATKALICGYAALKRISELKDKYSKKNKTKRK